MTIQSAAAHRLAPLPLVIGVTGHRDLREEDLVALQDIVRGIFERLGRQYPNSPLVLLSPLAEGADRLVARVALEMGVRLVVPLPMERAEYEKDFETKESREEFDRLIQNTEQGQYFELPYVGENTAAKVRKDSEARDQQYVQVGAYIAQHSQILLALWNGLDPNLPGGTAQIVKFKREGIPEQWSSRHSPLDPVDTGPVYHLLTPRQKTSELAGKPYELRVLYPTGYGSEQEAAEKFATVYREMDNFNRAAARHHHLLAANRRDSRHYLMSDEDFGSLEPTMQDNLRDLRDNFAVADSLAIHYASQTWNAFRWMFFFVFLAAFFVAINSNFKATDQAGLVPYLLSAAAYIAMLFGAYRFYKNAKRERYETHYQDCRALAEGLRVQFFWRLSGLKSLVADYYLRKQRSELEWIRHAIRVWSIPRVSASMQFAGTEEIPPGANIPMALNRWVRDQSNWFPRAIHRNFQNYHSIGRRAVQMFWMGTVGTVIFAIVGLVRTLQVWPQKGFHALDMLGDAVAVSVLSGVIFNYIKTAKTAHQLHEAPSHARATGGLSPISRSARKGLIVGVVLSVSVLGGVWFLHPETSARPTLTEFLAYDIPSYPEAGTEKTKAPQHKVSYKPYVDGFLKALIASAMTGVFLSGWYADKKGLLAHIKQYSRMSLIFGNAERHLSELLVTGDAEKHSRAAQQVIAELGREALAENADWVLIHRERPVEIPKP
ncbi:MAG: hypothetical protein K1X53_17565 [Candidatus Sumerlaeaceae bacterium]|nr:hypothetical protein [Candidatus Sumerlaeaceae bacterium]